MLTKEKIMQLFHALNEEMVRRNLHASLLVCGGALMALSYNKERVTEDVDALYQPKAEIEEVVARFSETRNLPSNWLNDAVTGYLNLAVLEPIPVLSFSNLEIKGIPEDALLAMKLMAGRQKDEDDILLLLARKGLYDPELLIENAQYYFPRDLFIGKKMMLKNLINQFSSRELAERYYRNHHHHEHLIFELTQYTLDYTWPRCLSASEIVAAPAESDNQKNIKSLIEVLLKEEKLS